MYASSLLQVLSTFPLMLSKTYKVSQDPEQQTSQARFMKLLLFS